MNKIHTFVVLAYKESKYLEDCINSVLNQKYKSNVVIATSTPNKYITNIAKKYELKVFENKSQKKGIGYDFDFAISCGNTELVTIAHQDDIYDYDYSEKIVTEYNKYKDSLILFSDYYEIKNDKKVYTNTNLKIKRILLFPMKFKSISGIKIFKRAILALGNSICCPAVTFVKEKTGTDVFESNMKCNIDWLAWERLSKQDGKFIFVKNKLMGHRVHDDSTTTEILRDNKRTIEDIEMFKKFWPKWIAILIAKLYKNSEKSNKV